MSPAHPRQLDGEHFPRNLICGNVVSAGTTSAANQTEMGWVSSSDSVACRNGGLYVLGWVEAGGLGLLAAVELTALSRRRRHRS